MKRLITLSGIALMVLAFVILTIFIIAPALIMPLDNLPPLKGIMQMALCKRGEVLTTGYSTYRRPGETITSIDYDCVGRDRVGRDVNDQVITVGMVGYLPTFLIGLFTYLFGVNLAEKDEMRAMKKRSSASGHRAARKPSRPPGYKQSLRKLKAELDAGIITEAEYFARLEQIVGDG